MIDANAPRLTLDTIDSTNAEAARRAKSGDCAPCWISAARQTAGRGRRGRSWVSERGNLFLTYLGPAERPAGEIALLGFCAALAVADLVDHFAGRPLAKLKWPNDVLIDGKKISGILLESSGAEASWFCVGIGVNLVSAPLDLRRDTVALAALTPSPPDLDHAITHLRQGLARWADLYDREGFATIREAWLDRASGLGAPATVRLGESAELSGVLEGLAANGALALRGADGEVRYITAGEVYFEAEGAL